MKYYVKRLIYSNSFQTFASLNTICTCIYPCNIHITQATLLTLRNKTALFLQYNNETL